MTSTRFFRLQRGVALVAFLGSAALVGLAAQPPKEKEDPKGTVKKKIVIDDDSEPTKKGTRRSRRQRPGRSSRWARKGRPGHTRSNPENPLLEVRGALRSHYGEGRGIADSAGSGSQDRMARFGRAGPTQCGGKPQEIRSVHTSDVRAADYFEGMIHAEVDSLLKQKTDSSGTLTNLTAAETLLSAASRFHEYAREHSYPNRKIPIRSGKGWMRCVWS